MKSTGRAQPDGSERPRAGSRGLRLPSALRTFAVAATGLLVASAVVAGASSNAPPPTPPVLGVYKGGGAQGVAALREYERWAGVPVPLALEFTPDQRWSEMTGADWLLDPWARSGRRIVYSVPLFPEPGADEPTSLAACAAGDYDRHWDRLGRRLVGKGMADTVVRPGWEFNGGWFHWSAQDDPEAFAACFRRLVTAMRAVAGQGFTFDWNPVIGPGAFPAERAWPGAEYVDYIGVDVYDVSWRRDTYPIPADASAEQVQQRRKRMWQNTLDGDHGLRFWSAFAKEQGVRLSIPEWGLSSRDDGHSGGDNPYFVRQMLEWVADPHNDVAYALYFDYDAHDGVHRISRDDDLFGEAAETYLEVVRTFPAASASTSAK